jgi:hypothetical protein
MSTTRTPSEHPHRVLPGEPHGAALVARIEARLALLEADAPAPADRKDETSVS